MKNPLAYIFLFIFSFQVLPVKEIGKILFKGQMTEEIHETSHDDIGSGKIKKADLKVFLKSETLASVRYLSSKLTVAIHETERLPRHFVPDILTPPPNRF
jgi:hypothetical protein